MSKRVPFCSACNTTHYNFDSCAEASARAARRAEEDRRERNRSQPIFRPNPRDWGNRVETMQVVNLGGKDSPQVLMRKKAA